MGGLDVCVHSLSLQEHNLRVAHLVRMYCLLSSSGCSCNPGLCLNLLWYLSSLSPPPRLLYPESTASFPCPALVMCSSPTPTSRERCGSWGTTPPRTSQRGCCHSYSGTSSSTLLEAVTGTHWRVISLTSEG